MQLCTAFLLSNRPGAYLKLQSKGRVQEPLHLLKFRKSGQKKGLFTHTALGKCSN